MTLSRLPLGGSSRPSRTAAVRTVVLLPAAVLMALTGCGKPQYCSDRSDLENSVRDLGNTPVAQNGDLSQLKSQLQKVQADAKKVASSAKSDFPTESSALQSSVSTLKTAVQHLPPSPSRQQLRPVAADAASVVASARRFKQATDSKC
jgi:hypothetical protein